MQSNAMDVRTGSKGRGGGREAMRPFYSPEAIQKNAKEVYPRRDKIFTRRGFDEKKKGIGGQWGL